MARGSATIHVIGYLGSDPHLKDANGTPVAEVSVAVNVGKKDAPRTNWYRLSIWGPQAERAKDWLRKGSLVHAVGDLDLREYQGRDGADRTSADVRVSRWDSLDAKQADGEGGQDRARTPETARQGANGTQSSYQPQGAADGDPGPSREPGEEAADDADLPF